MAMTSTNNRVLAIYRQEESEEAQACTIIHYSAEVPKRYARIWDANPTKVEWGWSLHGSAVRVWPVGDER